METNMTATTPLPITEENTKYFITEREYHLSRDGQYLTKPGAVIVIDRERGVYVYAAVDMYGRHLFQKIVTESFKESR
jgi:hypothetical protein